MRPLLVLTALAAALAAPAPAAHAASVRTMVVGRERVLRAPVAVRLSPRTVRVGGRRCAVGAATPLSALVGTRLALGVRDFGACGRSARDASGLFVARVGPDRNRGRDGWVYKVGRRAGTAGAADPAGPFGSGRLRGGEDVLWFWCTMTRSGSCQRTLEARPDTAVVAPGAPLRVTVRGYDDAGRGVPVGGASVRVGTAGAVTGADGVAVLAAPAAPGRARLSATRTGMVPAFPSRVLVR
jgi:hypothetical protein